MGGPSGRYHPIQVECETIRSMMSAVRLRCDRVAGRIWLQRAGLRTAPQSESVMADGTPEGIVSDEMEHKIFPTVTAHTFCVPRTHRAVDHGHSSFANPANLSFRADESAERALVCLYQD